MGNWIWIGRRSEEEDRQEAKIGLVSTKNYF